MDTNLALPLDIDLNSVDTSFPQIANGEIVDFVIDKVELGSTNKEPKVPMLKLNLKSLTPTKAVKGETLEPGIGLFHNLLLGLSGKMTKDQLVKGIASVTQAAGWSGNLNDFINGGYMTLQGMQVRVKVAFIPEGPDKSGTIRRAKNEVGLFIKK